MNLFLPAIHVECTAAFATVILKEMDVPKMHVDGMKGMSVAEHSFHVPCSLLTL